MPELESFLHMGGYARYVWPAWGLTLLVLVLNILVPLMRERSLRRQLDERFRRDGGE